MDNPRFASSDRPPLPRRRSARTPRAAAGRRRRHRRRLGGTPGRADTVARDRPADRDVTHNPGDMTVVGRGRNGAARAQESSAQHGQCSPSTRRPRGRGRDARRPARHRRTPDRGRCGTARCATSSSARRWSSGRDDRPLRRARHQERRGLRPHQGRCTARRAPSRWSPSSYCACTRGRGRRRPWRCRTAGGRPSSPPRRWPPRWSRRRWSGCRPARSRSRPLRGHRRTAPRPSVAPRSELLDGRRGFPRLATGAGDALWPGCAPDPPPGAGRDLAAVGTLPSREGRGSSAQRGRRGHRRLTELASRPALGLPPRAYRSTRRGGEDHRRVAEPAARPGCERPAARAAGGGRRPARRSGPRTASAGLLRALQHRLDPGGRCAPGGSAHGSRTR